MVIKKRCPLVPDIASSWFKIPHGLLKKGGGVFTFFKANFYMYEVFRFGNTVSIEIRQKVPETQSCYGKSLINSTGKISVEDLDPDFFPVPDPDPTT